MTCQAIRLTPRCRGSALVKCAKYGGRGNKDRCAAKLTTTTKTAGFPNPDTPQAFREMAEKGTKQAKETYEKMSAATTDVADLIKNSYSTAVEGVHDYNNKFIEFANANIDATFNFVQKLVGVNSPSAFVELSTEYTRKQFESLTEQAKQLTELAQKVTLATAEPLKTGFAKTINHAA